MSQNFGTSIDLTGNVIKNAGIEVVSSLPTDYLVEGREVIFQGEVFRYLNGEWHINSFSAFTLKTYTELRALKDSNALVTGSMYVLTDFYTTYLAEDGETWLGSPDCQVIDHLGNPIVSDNYHILLQATSENTFSPQAYIFNQPQAEKLYLKRMSDWIVQFDFNQDLFGRIIYMYDTRYKNTFDFDIYNIRWCWKGYQIEFNAETSDLNLLGGSINPDSDYYLWTIGDFICCNETFFDINPIYSIFPYGVMENTILDCSKIFLYVHSKSILNGSYYKALCRNNEFRSSSNIVFNYTVHSLTINFCSHLYCTKSPERSQIYNAENILNVGNLRGLNLGVKETYGEVAYYLTFIFPGEAYVNHHILRGSFSVFLAQKTAFSIDDSNSPCYPGIRRISIINNNTSSNGGLTGAFRIKTFVSDSEVIFPNYGYYVFAEGYIFNAKFTYPILNKLCNSFPTTFCKKIDDSILYMNYLDSNNEQVNTQLAFENVENQPQVIFYETFMSKKNKTYFMPFISFINNPTAWGYEIEGIQYPTREIFPVLACVFCNSGSINTQFAGKRLKFYVISRGTTFYSSEYTINTNGTLTKVS